MTWNLIAHTGQAASGFGSATTTGNINTSGANLIVFLASEFQNGTDTFDDSQHNTWSLATTGGSGNHITILKYCFNPSTSTTHNFTLGSGGAGAVFIGAFSGSASSPLDQVNHANFPGSTTMQPGSITPSQNGSLIVTGVAYQGSFSSIDSGFSVTDFSDFIGGTSEGGGLAYLFQGSAAAVNPTWTFTGSISGSALVASFLVGASAIGRPPSLPLIGVGGMLAAAKIIQNNPVVTRRLFTKVNFSRKKSG